MSKYKSQAVTLLQSAIDTLANAAEWEESTFMKALELGLEGEKRKNRYEASVDDSIRRYLQSAAYDTFETSVCPAVTAKVDFGGVAEPEQFFMAYQTFLWDLYEKLHEAANQLVAPLLLRKFACPLYDRCDCLLSEITETNRRLKRGRRNGWGHDLDIYETTWVNVHDKYEKLEAEHGYNF